MLGTFPRQQELGLKTSTVFLGIICQLVISSMSVMSKFHIQLFLFFLPAFIVTRKETCVKFLLCTFIC